MKILPIISILTFIAACQPSHDAVQKEIIYPLDTDIQTLDPVDAQDVYSHIATSQVYQTLLQYNYEDRPFRLEPLLAQANPEFRKEGREIWVRLKKNIFFHQDPLWGHAKRELTADDVVYSIERLAKSNSPSPNRWMVADTLEKVETVDRYTVRFLLKRKSLQFPYFLAMMPTAIVPREAVEKLGSQFSAHPIGTGPFRFREWRRGEKIIYEKNPDYWNDRDRQGHSLPYVEKLTLQLFVESQPKWLNFMKGNLDFGSIPKEAFHTTFDAQFQLKPEIAAKGIVSQHVPQADVAMLLFNMEDPVVGKNRYLRQAISAAVDRKNLIDLFYNGRAVEAMGPVPPGILGNAETPESPYRFNLEKAKELKALADASGKIKTLYFDTVQSTTSRQMAEAFAQDLKKIGIELIVRTWSWTELQSRVHKREVQLFASGWYGDYPDPENFLKLFYGPFRSPGPNQSNFRDTPYDRLFEKMRDMENGNPRADIIRKQITILQEEVPVAFLIHQVAYPVWHGWVRNYVRNEFYPGQMKYVDVDLEMKRKLKSKL